MLCNRKISHLIWKSIDCILYPLIWQTLAPFCILQQNPPSWVHRAWKRCKTFPTVCWITSRTTTTPPSGQRYRRNRNYNALITFFFLAKVDMILDSVRPNKEKLIFPPLNYSFLLIQYFFFAQIFSSDVVRRTFIEATSLFDFLQDSI